MSKSFKDVTNPAESFLSKPKIKSTELKDQRIPLLVSKKTKEFLREKAFREKTSINQLVYNAIKNEYNI